MTLNSYLQRYDLKNVDIIIRLSQKNMISQGRSQSNPACKYEFFCIEKEAQRRKKILGYGNISERQKNVYSQSWIRSSPPFIWKCQLFFSDLNVRIENKLFCFMIVIPSRQDNSSGSLAQQMLTADFALPEQLHSLSYYIEVLILSKS